MSRESAYWYFAYALLYTLCLAVFIAQFNISIHPDTAWLTQCAQRYMVGIPLIEGCYDSNPPLSILIYTPAVFLSKLTGLAAYYSVYLVIFAVISVSIITTHKVLSALTFLSPHERYIFLAAYITCAVIAPKYDFSQRDHIIAVTTVPFFLIQIAITKRLPLPAFLSHASLFFGAVMFLVKPHYGLIPTALLAHRLWSRKSLKILLDRDFLYLALTSATYIAAIFIFFQDFLNFTLPDVIHYYLPYNNSSDIARYISPYLIPLLISAPLCYFLMKDDKEKLFFYSFCWLATVISLLSFYMQGKGFYYQFIPFLVLFWTALSISVLSVVTFLKNKYLKPVHISVLIIAFLLPYPCYNAFRFFSAYTTHNFFEKAPLTAFIKKECGSPCSYFLTYPHMSLNTQTSFYVGETYASRFPAFWFYPVMEFYYGISEETKNSPEYQKKRSDDKARLLHYITKDFEKHKPNLIMVYMDPPETRGIIFDFFKYASDDKDFKELAKQYKKTGEFITDRKDYFGGTSLYYPYPLKWEVYKRIEGVDAPDSTKD